MPIFDSFGRNLGPDLDRYITGNYGEDQIRPEIDAGWTREDEDGWFIVERRELDDDVDGYWVSDRWGAEHFIPAAKMGDNWKSPEDR